MLNESFRLAMRDADACAEEISSVGAEKLRNLLEHRFAKKGGLPLWERLPNNVSRWRPDGWLRACEFVQFRETIIFFDRHDSQIMWKFLSGDMLARVFKNAPALQFYITDSEASFILCYNDHEYLIGVGACKKWLEKLENLSG